jgi:hypothetical protein
MPYQLLWLLSHDDIDRKGCERKNSSPDTKHCESAFCGSYVTKCKCKQKSCPEAPQRVDGYSPRNTDSVSSVRIWTRRHHEELMDIDSRWLVTLATTDHVRWKLIYSTLDHSKHLALKALPRYRITKLQYHLITLTVRNLISWCFGNFWLSVKPTVGMEWETCWLVVPVAHFTVYDRKIVK